MLIEIENIRQLKSGCTYALQLPKSLNVLEVCRIYSDTQRIEREKGISFILIQSGRLIDAPVPVEPEKTES